MKYKYLNISDIKKRTIKEFYNYLTEEDKKTYDNYVNIKRKKQFICGRILLDKLLKDKYNLKYDKVIIKKNKYGKPYISNYPIYFNISHSHNMVICVISENEIGIDLEKIRNINIKTIDQYAIDIEKEYILSNKRYINKKALKIYTLKEAYFKMKGTNLNNIKNISFTYNKEFSCNDKNVKIYAVKINKYVCSICEKASR